MFDAYHFTGHRKWNYRARSVQSGAGCWRSPRGFVSCLGTNSNPIGSQIRTCCIPGWRASACTAQVLAPRSKTVAQSERGRRDHEQSHDLCVSAHVPQTPCTPHTGLSACFTCSSVNTDVLLFFLLFFFPFKQERHHLQSPGINSLLPGSLGLEHLLFCKTLMKDHLEGAMA